MMMVKVCVCVFVDGEKCNFMNRTMCFSSGVAVKKQVARGHDDNDALDAAMDAELDRLLGPPSANGVCNIRCFCKL
jgi:hypothetical protein